MTLAGGVVVTVMVGHARVVADLVTVMDRRMMVVGVSGQRCHEGGAHHEQCENSRAVLGVASGFDRHAGLLCGEHNVAVPDRRVNTYGNRAMRAFRKVDERRRRRKLLRSSDSKKMLKLAVHRSANWPIE
jgi:hypothetical protein